MMEKPEREYNECQLNEASAIIVEAVKQCKAKNINPECFKDALFMYLSASFQCMYGEKWRIELLNHMEMGAVDSEEEANARN